MAYSTTAKNARLQAVADLIAGKVPTSSGAATQGKLVIGTSSLSGATGVLATIDLSTIPFSVAGGVATLLGVPLTATAIAAGTAAKAELRNNAGTVIRDGLTVNTGAADVIISSIGIAVGDQIKITSLMLTHG